MAEHYNLPYLAATGNATKVALLRCLWQGKNTETDMLRSLYLITLWLIAFHALWHGRCTNLAFSWVQQRSIMQTKKSQTTLMLYLTKLTKHSSTAIFTKSEVDISTNQHHHLPTVQPHFHQCTCLMSPVLSKWLCCEVWFSLLAEILPLVWPSLSGYRHFLLLFNCLLTSPVLKGDSKSCFYQNQHDIAGFIACLCCPFLSFHQLLHRGKSSVPRHLLLSNRFL